MAEAILDTIVMRELKPGDVLPPERELGEQFGVSRTVVREAVRALDARGLLEVRVGSRIRVAAVEPHTVHDAVRHFVRTTPMDALSVAAVSRALDVAAARAAAEHASEPELEQIRRRAAVLEDELSADAEAGFRRALLAGSHNELLIVLAEALAGLSTRQAPTIASPQRLRAVVSAIAGRDPDGAEQAIRGGTEEPGRPDTTGY